LRLTSVGALVNLPQVGVEHAFFADAALFAKTFQF
jgi:hypothetical protein